MFKNTVQSKITKGKVLIAIVLFTIFSSGFLAGKLYSDNRALFVTDEERQGQTKFINPLLECDTSSSLYNQELMSFEDDLQSLASSEINKGLVKSIGIYFRDLNNGPWFGVNSQEDYMPASLLKVPLMMSYYKISESDSSVLEQKLKFDSPEDLNTQFYKPKNLIKPGETDTVDSLIKLMILYSDNNSTKLLFDNIDTNKLTSIYTDLKVNVADVSSSNNFVSAKDYGAFFRVLYNASYLNREMSSKALELLSQTDFANGLRLGVPKDIVIAHKFGEVDSEAEIQLHDCGIIYYPKRPYLLCVMTKGNDAIKLAKVIKDVSKATYDEIQTKTKR